MNKSARLENKRMSVALALGIGLLCPFAPVVAGPRAVVNGKTPRLWDISIGSALDEDEPYRLVAGQEVMLWVEDCGAVVLVTGPAEFQLPSASATNTRLDLEVVAGKVMVASSSSNPEQAVHFVLPGTPQLDWAAPQGSTILVRTGADLDLAWLPGGAGATSQFKLGAQDQSITLGERISVRNGAISRQDAAGWAQTLNLSLVKTAGDLGLESARDRRQQTSTGLFEGLAYWDRLTQDKPELLLNVEQDMVRPDTRTVTATVGGAPAPAQSGRLTPDTPNVPGANEVPGISPASISVGGASGVAARNVEARRLLIGTGSRGLGFNGLSQLGVRGSSPAGPAIGPAGLGSIRP